MSDNVGLSTPRGSGTSGYVQRNLAHMRPRDRAAPYPPPSSRDLDSLRHRQRQPDREILEHDRKREVEVKVFELRDQLEDEEVDEDEIDTRCDALRKELLAKMNSGAGSTTSKKGLKPHQVHEMADAKIRESERLRSALRISRDYEEGGHWKRQEERLKKALEREAVASSAGAGANREEEEREEEEEEEGRRGRGRRDDYDL
ncbi:RNA-splicing factor [Diatrype stigma]|uniref:RNA-splicing factor n=1 Tax=Diatrype stigma TaxID=117547 RepID=A0AAN9UTT7_9PEZI